MAPSGIRFHTTRMPFKKTGLDDDLKLLEQLEFHAQLLADAKVDLIAMNCTAASLLAGPETVNRRIFSSTGIGSITTIEAILEALDRTGIKRIALLTPYVNEVVEAEVKYFEARGFEIVAKGGKPCDTPWEQGTTDPELWRALASELSCSRADGLLISCAGIQLASVLEIIEKEFGRPVIASNQALLWSCLRALGVQDRPLGFGSLLAGRFD